MTLLAQLMLFVFIGAWFVAVAAWFYGARFFLAMWLVGFAPRDRHKGYWKKVGRSLAVFLGAIVVGFAAVGIAELAGGW